MDWDDSTLYAVVEVSVDVAVTTVVSEALVEVLEAVSFLMGGED